MQSLCCRFFGNAPERKFIVVFAFLTVCQLRASVGEGAVAATTRMTASRGHLTLCRQKEIARQDTFSFELSLFCQLLSVPRRIIIFLKTTSRGSGVERSRTAPLTLNCDDEVAAPGDHKASCLQCLPLPLSTLLHHPLLFHCKLLLPPFLKTHMRAPSSLDGLLFSLLPRA